MSTTTEDIKARLNIVEVVGQYVRLQKAGSSWKANCPFHQEKTPSFNVNEERQMWHCFGCGKGGDVFAFVMEIEGLDFREALKLLADRAGVELPAYRGEGERAEKKDRSFEILELATKFYEKQLWESARGKKILEYLHDRGLSDDSIRTFRLGYAPDGWEFVTQFLLGRGFGGQEIEDTGLAIRGKERRGHYDRFRDRIMFPIGDVLGRVIGYSARVAPGGDESQAKYVNTPETGIYHKSRALYGLAQAKQAIKEAGFTILVEGNMDVIALHQAGMKNTVAVSGTALTLEQLTLLKRYGKKVALFFDMDKAGQAAAWKSTVAALSADFVVTAIALSSGKDAADMNRDNPDELRAAVDGAKPALLYFLEVLKREEGESPEGSRRIVERYAELLSSVGNDLDRAHWTKTLAETIHADPKVVQATVERAFRSVRKGETFTEKNPTRSFLPKTFGSRSEVLREGIVGLMLVHHAVAATVLEEKDEVVRAFIIEHPLTFFIQNNPVDPIASIEERALQNAASELLFKTLELPLFAESEDKGAVAIGIAEEYLRELASELHGRDELKRVGEAIALAQKNGDAQEAQRLLAEFARLTRRDATENK